MRKSTITRTDLTTQLVEKSGLPRAEALILVENLLNIMATALKTDQVLKIPTFGSFSVREKPTRPGRNPKTGKAAEIPPRRVIVFHPSPRLRRIFEER